MGPGKPLRILLADDEPVVHDTLGDYLRDCGHDVDAVFSGDEVMARLSAEAFDLALLDVRMPGSGGLEIIERALEQSPLLPIVVISGNGSMETVIQAMRAGAVDYLRKPVKLLSLEATLEKAIRAKAQRTPPALAPLGH